MTYFYLQGGLQCTNRKEEAHIQFVAKLENSGKRIKIQTSVDGAFRQKASFHFVDKNERILPGMLQ